MVLMYKPSMIDSPSGGMLEKALAGTEGCGGGTPDLSFFLEVWGYIRGVGVGNKSGGPRGGHEVGGAPRGCRACPPPSWMAQDSSGPTLLLQVLLLVHKKSP